MRKPLSWMPVLIPVPAPVPMSPSTPVSPSRSRPAVRRWLAAAAMLGAATAPVAVEAQPDVHVQQPSRAQPSSREAPADARTIVTQVCAACHGADGNSRNPQYPSLAQQGAVYLYDQLLQFAAQGGQRASGVMGAMAVHLTPTEMRSLADYFAQQTLKPGPPTYAPLAARGESIYLAGIPNRNVASCASCHGIRGEGLPATFPRLAGQHAQYIATQLRQFRAHRRNGDPEAMMRNLAAQLSDTDIDAVAQYVAGLRHIADEGMPIARSDNVGRPFER